MAKEIDGVLKYKVDTTNLTEDMKTESEMKKEVEVFKNEIDKDILGNAQIVLAAYESDYYEYFSRDDDQRSYYWDKNMEELCFSIAWNTFEGLFKPDVRIIDVSDREPSRVLVKFAPQIGRYVWISMDLAENLRE